MNFNKAIKQNGYYMNSENSKTSDPPCYYSIFQMK